MNSESHSRTRDTLKSSMFKSGSSRYYERIKIRCNIRDQIKFPNLETSYKAWGTAAYIFDENFVHQHFQERYKYVESLFKVLQSARMNYARYDTYLAFKTIPPDVQESMSETFSNLSKEEWESEALKLTKQREGAAFSEQVEAVHKLAQILEKNPRFEHIEWLQLELFEMRFEFSHYQCELLSHRSPLTVIKYLYFREREKLDLFILKEWGKLHYQIGQEERKWIKSIKQQNEQNSKQPQPPRSTSTPDSGSEAGSSEHED